MSKLAPMERARSRIAMKHVFFAALILTIPYIAADVGTACTDMVKVYYDPSFVAQLDMDELIFLNIHEIMHIMLKHGLRCGERDPYIWNVACDHRINLTLKKYGLKLIMHPEWKDYGPEGFRCHADHRFDDMSEEQIYNVLKQEEPDKGDEGDEGDQESGNGKPKPGEGKPKPGDKFDSDILPTPDKGSEEERRKIERKIDQDVARAVTIAKARGVMPAGFETLIKEFFAPQVPWETILRRFMKRYSRTKTSWEVRDRRYHNVYLPSRAPYGLREVDIINDSSGSMFDQRIFKYCGSEINGILKTMKPSLVRVVWADDEDCSFYEEFKPKQEVILHPKGGGGTDMRKPLKFIEQYNPEFAILITDGYTPWPNTPTKFPLIICCTTGAACPDWAMVVRVVIPA